MKVSRDTIENKNELMKIRVDKEFVIMIWLSNSIELSWTDEATSNEARDERYEQVEFLVYETNVNDQRRKGDGIKSKKRRRVEI